MSRNTGQRLAICALMGTILAIPYEARAAEEEQRGDRIRKSLTSSLPYLTVESRKWMDGEVKIQNGRQCVSCHQVPAGAWSQSLAENVLRQSPSQDTLSLMQDAVEFVSQEEGGAAASWAQLLIAFPLMKSRLDDTTLERMKSWKASLLKKQRDDGLWPASGQFFKQARPEIESDGVVTMWMLAALPNVDQQDDQIKAASKRALNAIKTLSLDAAKTTEWMAWRALTARNAGESSELFVRRLLALQHRDGSWSWLVENKAGDAYATGTILFVLHALAKQGEPFVQSEEVNQAMQKAIDFLLDSQATNGAWTTPSRLISANESERRDYVYDFWGSAWATLGLASSLEAYSDAHTIDRPQRP